MIELNRRGFLFGTASTLIALKTAPIQKVIEVAMPSEERWRRLAVTLDVQDPGLIDILLNGNRGAQLLGPQLEQKLFPTSYIPTRSTHATRAAEIAEVKDPYFGQVIRATPATLFDPGSGSFVAYRTNEARLTEQGLLVEGESTNYFLNSERPVDQRVALPIRGAYTFSVYVKGTAQVQIVGSGGRVFAAKELPNETGI